MSIVLYKLLHPHLSKPFNHKLQRKVADVRGMKILEEEEILKKEIKYKNMEHLHSLEEEEEQETEVDLLYLKFNAIIVKSLVTPSSFVERK